MSVPLVSPLLVRCWVAEYYRPAQIALSLVEQLVASAGELAGSHWFR